MYCHMMYTLHSKAGNTSKDNVFTHEKNTSWQRGIDAVAYCVPAYFINNIMSVQR